MAASRNRPSPEPVGSLRNALVDGLRRLAGLCSPGRGPGDLRCAVGLSGGRDSVVLLHALAGLRAETGVSVSALHVHHGLSPNADRWVAFCTALCHGLDVPLAIERVTVDPAGGRGIEGAARAARHAAFARLPADVVLLAHHAGDQAETMLFNLLRGSGLNGASAMAPLRRTVGGGPWLLRPWLDQPAETIEAYRACFDLPHVDDESNRNTAFSRNFLRHRVLAPVESRFPGATRRLSGAARRLGEVRTLLAELADADLAGIAAGAALDLAALAPLSPARRQNALRRWLELRSIVLGEDRLEELCRQLDTPDPASQAEIRCGNVVLRWWRGHLHVMPVDRLEPEHARAWRGEPAIDWGGGTLTLTAAEGAGIAGRFASGMEIRPRTGGERMRLRVGGPTRPLRLLFQESAVPPWERDALPFLWLSDRLVAVPGIGVAAEFAAVADERGFIPRWERRAPDQSR
jgi:tRNA(Ile)-lysidine synthase